MESAPSPKTKQNKNPPNHYPIESPEGTLQKFEIYPNDLNHRSPLLNAQIYSGLLVSTLVRHEHVHSLVLNLNTCTCLTFSVAFEVILAGQP